MNNNSFDKKMITVPIPELPEKEEKYGVDEKSCFINRLRVPKIQGIQFPPFDADKVLKELEMRKAQEEMNNQDKGIQKVKK